jgi:hypothetical protein
MGVRHLRESRDCLLVCVLAPIVGCVFGSIPEAHGECEPRVVAGLLQAASSVASCCAFGSPCGCGFFVGAQVAR